MAWITPPVFVSGNAFTAAQANILSGDLNETAPAKFTAAGQILVSTGANTGAARTPEAAQALTIASTTSTAFTDVAGNVGPSVTVTTGTQVIFFLFCQMSNNTAGQGAFAGLDITGATTSAPFESISLAYRSETSGAWIIHSACNIIGGLNAGSHTFKMQYKATGATASFEKRRLTIFPL